MQVIQWWNPKETALLGNLPIPMRKFSNNKLPWAPTTMKNKGLGHRKTRLCITKTSKNVGLGGPWYIHGRSHMFPNTRFFSGRHVAWSTLHPFSRCLWGNLQVFEENCVFFGKKGWSHFFFKPLRRVYLEKKMSGVHSNFPGVIEGKTCATKSLPLDSSEKTRPQLNKFLSEKDGFIVMWFFAVSICVAVSSIWPSIYLGWDNKILQVEQTKIAQVVFLQHRLDSKSSACKKKLSFITVYHTQMLAVWNF